MKTTSKRLSGLARLLLAAALLVLSSASGQAQDPTVVYLVRHAEKTGSGDDPGLSAAGRERAARLAVTLRNAGIQTVFSTDYNRTRDTAAPLARSLGLETTLYDPSRLESLAGRLREFGGRSLVVGHSNTTPQVVALLGGTPGAPIEESSEYDRLYVVTLPPGSPAETVLLRYGRDSRPSRSEP